MYRGALKLRSDRAQGSKMIQNLAKHLKVLKDIKNVLKSCDSPKGTCNERQRPFLESNPRLGFKTV